MKNIIVEINTSCGTKGLPQELLEPSLPSSWSADELNAFSLIALGTASPTYVGFTLADTWAHQRYTAALDPTKKNLTLRPEWQDLDPHQKTILADDWGVGFSLLYLTETVALKYFSPTGWWLKCVEAKLGRKIKISRKKTGPPKLPDYVGIDAYGYMHALECKGTQQSRTHLRKQTIDGVKQVENLRAKSALPKNIRDCFRGWMVGGLYVPQASSKQLPLLVIADPEFDDLAKALREAGGILEAKRGIRLTMLCQQLGAVGLPRLATTLFNGRTNPNEAEFLRSANDENAETRFMELRRDGDRLSRRNSLRVFDIYNEVRTSTHVEQARTSGRVFDFDYSLPAELLSELTKTISNDGIVHREALNDVLDNVAALGAPEQKKSDLAKGPTRESGWVVERTSGRALLRSPFGIEIRTSSYIIDRP